MPDMIIISSTAILIITAEKGWKTISLLIEGEKDTIFKKAVFQNSKGTVTVKEDRQCFESYD